MNGEQIRWRRVNAGSDTKPMVWKLSGLREIVPFGASILVGLIVMRFSLGVLGLAFPVALTVGGCVPLMTVAFLLRFVSGKPSRHLSHTVHWWSTRLSGKSLSWNWREKGGGR